MSSSPITAVKSLLASASVPAPDDGTLEALLAVADGNAAQAARLIIDDHRAGAEGAQTQDAGRYNDGSAVYGAQGLRRRRPMEFAENEHEFDAAMRRRFESSSPSAAGFSSGPPGGILTALASALYHALTLPASLLLGVARLLRIPGLLCALFPSLRRAGFGEDMDEDAEARGIKAAAQFKEQMQLMAMEQREETDEGEERGSTEPLASTLLESSYNDALRAAKADLKLLIVVLTRGSSRKEQGGELYQGEDYEAMRTLTSPGIITQLSRPDIIVWGASTRRKEGHLVARQLGARKQPFIACLAMAAVPRSSPRLAMIARISGSALASQDAMISWLDDSRERSAVVLETLRADKVSRETERRLMEEQDRAYAEASAKDLERVRQKRAEEQRAQEDEQKRQEEERMQKERGMQRKQWKRWIRAKHAGGRLDNTSATSATSAAPFTVIAAALPNGKRIEGRFATSARVEDLYMWVAAHAGHEHGGDGDDDASEDAPQDYEHDYQFCLFFGYPRRRLAAEEAIGSALKIADVEGLFPRANLIVEGTLGSDDEGGASSSDGSDGE
ncbi:unnamed protein product [Jaminaea pallidilutea]